jgi:hypothetical protein
MRKNKTAANLVIEGSPEKGTGLEIMNMLRALKGEMKISNCRVDSRAVSP